MEKTVKIREKNIETYFMAQVKKIDGYAIKYKSPDRILFYEKRCFLVELKRPGGKPRPLQQSLFKKFLGVGFPVYVLSTNEQVDNFFFCLEYL